MVHAYWLVGREVVEVEQGGKERTEYGEAVVRRLAAQLSNRFGKGFCCVARQKQITLRCRCA
ncbi:MAG: hypothetical protein CL908_10920 [Deltaproteobacteria bacterium]|nr:hypothetical protein [Deltaproteobacteria bacterium]